MKNVITKVIVTVFLLGTVLSSMLPLAFAETYKDHGSDFLTGMQLLDKEGNPIKPGQVVGLKDSLKVEYEWEIPDDVTIEEGDTIRFPIPDQLKPGNVNMEIRDEDGNLIGNGTVDPNTGELVITFTDYYQEHPFDKNGTGWISVVWNREEVEEGDITEIELGDHGSIEVGVGGNEEVDPEEGLLKYGWIDPNKPDEIIWVVRVNLSEYDIQNATFTDILGANQSFIEDSIIAIYVKYNDTGEVSQWQENVDLGNNNLQFFDDRFEIDLGHLTRSIYLEYRTKITDDGEAGRYENSVKLTGLDGQEWTDHSFVKETESGGSGGGSQGGKIEVIKHDADNKEKLLAGAEFDVFDSNGKLVDHIIVGQNGHGQTSKQLEFGDYTLVETKAPDGYELDTTPIDVTVSKGETSNLATVDVDNKEKPTEPTESETEPTEPTETETEPTEPTESETEPTEPTESETEPTEPTEATEQTEPTEPTEATEPTEPTEATEPTEPTDPTEPTETETESTESETEPTKPTESETESTNPVGTTSSDNNDQGGVLPQTGEKTSPILVGLGSIIIIGLGIIGIRKYRS